MLLQFIFSAKYKYQHMRTLLILWFMDTDKDNFSFSQVPFKRIEEHNRVFC